MRNTGEYSDLAADLAQQFLDRENVDTGNLTYLRDFSDASRGSYDRLMDRIADMYEVVPRDAISERRSRISVDKARILGASALAGFWERDFSEQSS